MQLARKNVTSDPFVVYGYYKILEKEIQLLDVKDKPECVGNCDETEFPRDPTKWKHIGPVGKNHLSNSSVFVGESTYVLGVSRHMVSLFYILSFKV